MCLSLMQLVSIMFPTDTTKTLHVVSEKFYCKEKLDIASAQCSAVSIKKPFEFFQFAFKLVRLSKDKVMMVGFMAAAGLRKEARVTRLLRNLSQTFWSDRILRLLCRHLRFISASCHAAEMSTLKNATMTCLFRILMLLYYGNFT